MSSTLWDGIIDENDISIAIIGAGPRGLSVLERLSANLGIAQGCGVRIELFDPYPPGGRIWTTEQPQHLLMNTLCADATHFTDSSVRCSGPIRPGPTLFDWCQQVATGNIGAEDQVISEAAGMRPWSHPSRKLLGEYLTWCYAKDVEGLPENVRFNFHRTTVTSLTTQKSHFLLGTEGSAELRKFDSVILATGHSDLLETESESRLRIWAEEHGRFYGRPTNPLQQDLSRIEPREKVLVRGLGMNFFDYVSLLTVGRGGKFVPDGGHLRYIASGQEPIIVAGSRRGVPYRAKGIFDTMAPAPARRYFTEKYLAELKRGGTQLDFMLDLWPCIAKDTAWVYYAKLFDIEPEQFECSFTNVEYLLDSTDWGSLEFETEIRKIIPNEYKRINFSALYDPLYGQQFENYADFQKWWRADLVRDHAEAVQGTRSPLKCASVALGSARAAIRELARYGGLHGQSFNDAVEGWFRGFAGSQASGPPAQRILELLALVDAGSVLPVGPNMQITREDGVFVASSPAVNNARHQGTGLLEAHLPPVRFERSSNPIIRSLRKTEKARSYVIPDRIKGDFTSGAIEVTLPPYVIKDASGKIQPGLFAIGVPLEGIHWGTQLGPIAETNSQFLRDTDSVARAALRQAKDKRSAPPALTSVSTSSRPE